MSLGATHRGRLRARRSRIPSVTDRNTPLAIEHVFDYIVVMATATLPRDIAADLASGTTDRLEQVLTEAESAIGRLRHLQTLAIRELDRRQVPFGDGARTLADWISARIDVTPETAKSLGRVSMSDSAELAAALVEGDATFDRVAEVAKAGDADLRHHLDLVGVRREIACRRELSESEERSAFERRTLIIQPDLLETTWKLWGRLPAIEGHIVVGKLDQLADELPTGPTREPHSTRRADALVALCAGDDDSAHTVNTTVIVDATGDRDRSPSDGETELGDTPAAWMASGPRVGPATLERLLCESSIDVIAKASDGTPLAIGDSRTAIPPKTRRWVLARDGGMCTVDGCSSSTRLQPHHIRPRSGNGDNDPENLASLCWYHHHIVIHGLGFTIDPTSPPRRRRLRPPGSDPPDRDRRPIRTTTRH